MDSQDYSFILSLQINKIPLYHALKLICALGDGFEYTINKSTVTLKPAKKQANPRSDGIVTNVPNHQP
jgi:hypothetical protein